MNAKGKTFKMRNEEIKLISRIHIWMKIKELAIEINEITAILVTITKRVKENQE